MPSHKPKYGSFFKFHQNDVFRNRIKTHPKVEFFIYSGSVYYNNEPQNASNTNTPNGMINLYELNVNRSSKLIYPFVIKDSPHFFKTISDNDYVFDYLAGEAIAMEYPLTSSISIDRWPGQDPGSSDGKWSTDSRKKYVLYALNNTLNNNVKYSQQFTNNHVNTLSGAAVDTTLGDKINNTLNLISIPSIFYGSSIKKGSLKLKYYITGTLAAEASDINRNGEIIQTSGAITDSSRNWAQVGDCIGLVLYNEGFIFLTSSDGKSLSNHTEQYKYNSSTAYNSSWYYFGATGSYPTTHTEPSSSYKIEFEGTNYINVVTMLAHAKKNQLNFSNNPTYLATGSYVGSQGHESGAYHYYENSKINIKNIASSSYGSHSASFEPITYISKIAIYDENRNVIAYAGLANPVKKTMDRNYTFKLKLDI